MSPATVKTTEYISINADGSVSALLRAIAFNDPSGFICIYLPSVAVNGYGKTIDDAKEMLTDTMNIFFQNLSGMERLAQEQELSALGFMPSDSLIQSKFEKAGINQKGSLENFEIDEEQIIEDSSYAF